MKKVVVAVDKAVQVQLVEETTGEVVAVGVAHCSNTDKFDYNKGVKIATLRAHSEVAYDMVANATNKVVALEMALNQAYHELDKAEGKYFSLENELEKELA